MKLSFYGASEIVTGSNYLLEVNKTKLLVDCGLFQGSASVKSMNFDAFRYEPRDIDFLILTHAHIDHSGRIPLLYKKGFRGTVLCTKPTVDLCSIMLPDSGHIQESETRYKNKKRQRSGLAPLEPLYTLQDALDCLKIFKSIQYNSTTRLTDDISVRLKDAGHLLGSAMVEIWVKDNDKTMKLVFTGDLGKKDTPIINDPSIIDEADYLVMESTYGNRTHETPLMSEERMFHIIEETLEKRGTVVIPSFSVGRTQEMIYKFNAYKSKDANNASKTHKVPVYIDSPLSVAATEVFKNNIESYDEEAKTYLLAGNHPLDFTSLIFTRTTDESKALNESHEPKIIISSSGMCEAGRIRHHLKHNIWKTENTILFIGYQAEGTLGRRIVDGAESVQIHGETLEVNARVEMIDGFSGHGDKDALDAFLAGFKKMPKKVFLVHGEEEQIIPFRDRIRKKFGIDAIIPKLYEVYELTCEACRSVTPEAERTIREFSYKRLELLNYIKKIETGIHALTEKVSYDIMNQLDDEQIESIIDEYRTIDGGVMRILDSIAKERKEKDE